MFIKEVFETKIEEKIDPVIKVGERENDQKLAAEIGNFVVTPTIETLLEEVLENYTDTILSSTDQIGIWISGYFGSGKSHLAKIISLLIENRKLDGIAAAERFKSRIAPSSRYHDSILRHLTRIPQCNTQVLAFNLNTLIGSKTTPLPLILLNQYYVSKGYSSNHIFAKVIESELDSEGKLEALHKAAERLIGKPWQEIKENTSFFGKKLNEAVCEVAPDHFSNPEDVQAALKNAEKGDLYNIQFLITTLISDLQKREKQEKKPCRLMMVMDETGQWIGDDGEKLHLLQALVEEAGSRGQGKIWVTVTTHEDMGSIIKNAKGLKTDMKKIEARFEFKISLTTENIERVLEDRLLKKNIAGRKEIISVYNMNAGVLRGMGQLENTDQKLPDCTEDGFVKFYPFFPYHIHLIPDIVKSLRSAGGRGEQLSGSTRTLLAITQDIICGGRRKYLTEPVGDLVSFDEVYGNLEGSEVNPEVRRDLNNINSRVVGATDFTRRVAEILYLTREITYIPKTPGNVARFLVERSDEDLSTVIRKISPELEKLQKAKLVARIGEEYEFLTKSGQDFELDVIEAMESYRWPDILKGIEELEISDILDFSTLPYLDWNCPVRIRFDNNEITHDGDVIVQIYSPLMRIEGKQIPEIEDESTHQNYKYTIFVLSQSVPKFDEQIRYFIAMQKVIELWKGDPHKSEEARKLATDREGKDLKKQRDKIRASIKEGLRQSQIIFRGSSHTLIFKKDQSPSSALQSDLAQFMPGIYSKYDKVPYRVQREQNLIVDVLRGDRSLTADMKGIGVFDKAGTIDKNSSLLFEIRSFMNERRSDQKKERVLGADLLKQFTTPPYGWHQGAIRAGVAALVRTGDMKVFIEKKPFTNPEDSQLQNALKNVREFNRVQLELEETETSNEILVMVRKELIALIGKRNIPEIPQGIADAMREFSAIQARKAQETALWAGAAQMPLTTEFSNAKDLFERFGSLSNPHHVISEIHTAKEKLPGYVREIGSYYDFMQKWGQSFTEMRDFARELSAIRFKLPKDGNALAFLDNWNHALSNIAIIHDNIWKTLQTSKNSAQIEITELVNQLKTTLEGEVTAAVRIIEKMYADAELTEKYQENGIRKQLQALQEEIDRVVGISAAINNGELTRQNIRRIIESAQEEIQKLKPGIVAERQKEKLKVFTKQRSVIITSESEWDTFRDKLDQRVKDVLKTGKNVELE